MSLWVNDLPQYVFWLWMANSTFYWSRVQVWFFKYGCIIIFSHYNSFCFGMGCVCIFWLYVYMQRLQCIWCRICVLLTWLHVLCIYFSFLLIWKIKNRTKKMYVICSEWAAACKALVWSFPLQPLTKKTNEGQKMRMT